VKTSRPTSTRQRAAFTKTELIVVIIVLVAIVACIAPAFSRAKAKSVRIYCIDNLKTIGGAYNIWRNDHGDQYPTEAAAANGGWSESLAQGNAGPRCWRVFLSMSNELGKDPTLLTCPSDERKPAITFPQISNNLSLSYFTGVGVNGLNPQGILGGDRNLGPGPNQDPDYGYSPANGQGNDVILRGPVCWSEKMHTQGNMPAPATSSSVTAASSKSPPPASAPIGCSQPFKPPPPTTSPSASFFHSRALK
jgi:hypothetical protein